MKNITLVTIADACGGRLCGTDGMAQERLKEEASCVVIDSRKIEKGGMENEKLHLDDLKNDEITKKREK